LPGERPLIAYDATSLPPRPAGAGRYVVSLIDALTRCCDDFDYAVYARRQALPFFEPRPGVSLVDAGALGRGRRYVWEQTGLPLELRRRRPALLHSPHHTTPLLAPCPRVLTVHDLTFFLLPERYPLSRRLFFQAMTRLSVQRAELLLVPSAAVADDLVRLLSVRRERVRITPEGVGASFRPLLEPDPAAPVREKYGLSPCYLLSVGTREPGKNRLVLFRALRAVCDRGFDVQLAVVGQEGWLSRHESAAVESLGLGARVRFTGYVPEDDLVRLYNGAAAFLFPSLYEGFGLPVLEAMACGTPVVASDVSAIPEVAGDAALLVDPRDPGAIAGAAAALLTDEALRLRLRQAGLTRAAAYTWEACARATAEAYLDVLRGS
jgi:glycosyltransferase involved in cell wall biosynthesis